MNTKAQALFEPAVSNADWAARKAGAMARGQGHLAPVFAARAEGSEIWDIEGKRYIDFASGIAVCNTGHVHPRIKEAVAAQLDRFTHTCLMVTPYPAAVELAEKLNRLAPGSAPKKTVFLSTGAEAVENAVKIARAYTRRRGVIAFNGGFHGRTLLAMGLTGKITPYKNSFGPFPGEIFHAPFPIAYHGIGEDDSLAALETLFKVAIAPNDVAALIIEPVQGEGGFYPASNGFLQALRRICDRHGIVLIVDEIQTGFARTGRLFCCEYAGIEPDLMTVAKGIAGGFPLSAVIGKSGIMDAPLPGGLGGTYGGSPIACAAALAVIETIESERLANAAKRISLTFRERLQKLKARFPAVIGDVRTDRGAMIAVELVQDGKAELPNAALTGALVAAANAGGLVLLSCGVRGNVIRCLPALTITDELVHEGMDIFERCLVEILSNPPASAP